MVRVRGNVQEKMFRGNCLTLITLNLSLNPCPIKLTPTTPNPLGPQNTVPSEYHTKVTFLQKLSPVPKSLQVAPGSPKETTESFGTTG